MILAFGSINVDLVARAPAIPKPGETVLSPGHETLFGGKGANQAVAAARLAPSGTAVAMAGQVGDDAFGKAALRNLRELGVGTSDIRVGPEPTGCAFIVVDAAGENAITVSSGANGALRADAVTRPFAPVDVLLLQIETPRAASLELARRAKAEGARVLWSLAPFPRDATAAELRDIAGASDVLIGNAGEMATARDLLDVANGDDADPAVALLGLARAAGALCVQTDGPRGAAAASPDGETWRAAALPVDVADTVGAGDAFAGALAAAIAREGDGFRAGETGASAVFGDALAFACAAASLACRTRGAQSGLPTADEVRAALDSASAPAPAADGAETQADPALTPSAAEAHDRGDPETRRESETP